MVSNQSPDPVEGAADNLEAWYELRGCYSDRLSIPNATVSPPSGQSRIYGTLLRGIIGAVLISLLAAIAVLANLPLILTSWAGSAAVILWFPGSPVAHPRRILVAHLVSGASGLALRMATGIEWWPIGIAVGLALALLLLFDAEHPPAVANAAIVFTLPIDAVPFMFTVLVGASVLASASALLVSLAKHLPRALPILSMNNSGAFKKGIDQ